MSALKKIISAFSLFNDHAKRVAVFEKVDHEMNLSGSFLALIIGSSIVATLGLLINSSVVVMGAMLMAPLYWPIIGVALGVVSGDKKVLTKALKITLISTIVALVFSAGSAYLSPISRITHEIQVRASPTLLDLVIALITSIIGVLAVYDPRVSSSIVGVALSLSLLPPLSAAGVGLSMKNKEIFWGAFQLYLANVISIVFVGALTFYFLKFKPKNGEEKQRFSIGLSSSLILLILLGTMFTLYLQQSIYISRLRNQINEDLQVELAQFNPKVKADNININFTSEGSLWHANIDAMVYLPEDQLLTKKDQELIAARLGRLISGNVNLQLNLVNTLIAESREQQRQQLKLHDSVSLVLKNAISQQNLDLEILDLQLEETSQNLLVTAIIIGSRNNFDTGSFHSQITTLLQKKLEQKVDVKIHYIPATVAQ